MWTLCASEGSPILGQTLLEGHFLQNFDWSIHLGPDLHEPSATITTHLFPLILIELQMSREICRYFGSPESAPRNIGEGQEIILPL